MKRLIWLVAVVMALLFIEGALVAAVVISPTAREDLTGVSASISNTWTGDDVTPGVAEWVSTGISGTYREWVTPLWSTGAVAVGEPVFSKCVSCHTDYGERRSFNTVYMNHPVHDELGLSCDTCHTDVAHPGPLPPEEKVCAGCHDEVSETGQCQLCHPPGSLAHFYLMDMPRSGYVDCNTCHLPGLFTSEGDHHLVGETVFDGSVPAECVDCHSATTCQQCHAEEHPDDWPSIHGAGVSHEGKGSCQVCHSGQTCSACHSDTATNPFQQKPLPTGGHP